MIKPKLVIVHAMNVQPEFRIQHSIHAPKGTIYILPDQDPMEPSLVNYMRSVREAEKQMNEWIRKYDNVLQGLKYWKSKALEKL